MVAPLNTEELVRVGEHAGETQDTPRAETVTGTRAQTQATHTSDHQIEGLPAGQQKKERKRRNSLDKVAKMLGLKSTTEAQLAVDSREYDRAATVEAKAAILVKELEHGRTTILEDLHAKAETLQKELCHVEEGQSIESTQLIGKFAEFAKVMAIISSVHAHTVRSDEAAGDSSQAFKDTYNNTFMVGGSNFEPVYRIHALVEKFDEAFVLGLFANLRTGAVNVLRDKNQSTFLRKLDLLEQKLNGFATLGGVGVTTMEQFSLIDDSPLLSLLTNETGFEKAKRPGARASEADISKFTDYFRSRNSDLQMGLAEMVKFANFSLVADAFSELQRLYDHHLMTAHSMGGLMKRRVSEEQREARLLAKAQDPNSKVARLDSMIQAMVTMASQSDVTTALTPEVIHGQKEAVAAQRVAEEVERAVSQLGLS